jgi:hypothetical protein
VRDDAELFRRLLELGSMDAHQLHFALKNAGRIDDESGLLELMQRIEQKGVRLVRRIGIVELA